MGSYVKSTFLSLVMHAALIGALVWGVKNGCEREPKSQEAAPPARADEARAKPPEGQRAGELPPPAPPVGARGGATGMRPEPPKAQGAATGAKPGAAKTPGGARPDEAAGGQRAGGLPPPAPPRQQADNSKGGGKGASGGKGAADDGGKAAVAERIKTQDEALARWLEGRERVAAGSEGHGADEAAQPQGE